MEKPNSKITRRKFFGLTGAVLVYGLSGCTKSPENPTSTPTLGVEMPTTQATQEIISIPTLSIQTPEPTKQFPTIAAITASPTPGTTEQGQQNIIATTTNTPSTLMPMPKEEKQIATPTLPKLQPITELKPESITVMSRCHDIIKVDHTLQSTSTEEGTATLTCSTVDGNKVKVIISIGIGQHVPTTGLVTEEKRIGDQLHTIAVHGTTYFVTSFYNIQ